MKPFECSGIWWTREDPENRVAGTLSFAHDDGLRLALLGTFGEVGGTAGRPVHPVILGSVNDSPSGPSVTLTDCRQKSYTLSSPGLDRESYAVGRAFFGAFLTDEDDFLFAGCAIRLSGLADWAHHLTGFRFGERGTGVGPFDLTYHDPLPRVAVELPDGTLGLGWGASYAGTSREFSFKEEACFNVSVRRPLDERTWNDQYVYPLENFLTFATDTPSALEKLELRRGEGEDGHPSVVMVAPRVSKESVEKVILPHRMLFTLQDLGDEAPRVLRRWLEIHRLFRDACIVFFGVQYSYGRYQDTKLLWVMQSLQLYDRRRHGSGPGPEPLAVPAEILDGLPERTRSQLLAWLNAQALDTFQATLTRLSEEHWAVLAPLAGGQGKDEFLVEVMAIRNYVLHRGSDLGRSESYPMRLLLVVQQLMFLMKACLLSELGFSDENQLVFFRRNQMYGFICEEATRLRGGG